MNLNPRRLLTLGGAAAAVAAAAAVVVVAASFALYAVAREWLGPAGGAAVVAAVFAVIGVVIAVVATRKAKLPPKSKTPPPPASPIDQAIALAKQRPLIAAAVAAGAGVVLIRNPALVTAVVSAFMAGEASKPPPK